MRPTVSGLLPFGVVAMLGLAGCTDGPAPAGPDGGEPVIEGAAASRAGADRESDDGDGDHRDDSSPARYSDWSDPVNLGSIVNSPATEIEVSVSRNGRSLYFASNRNGGFDIWVSGRDHVDDPWSLPRNLGAGINSAAREQGPFLSRDGHRLYFFSDRPGGFGGLDLYVSRRRDTRDDFGWETPQNLGGGVNGPGMDALPVVFEDDVTGTTTLYFSSNRGLAVGDIYASTLQPDETFGPAVLVHELSSPRRDRVLTVRRDGLEIFLASDRPGPAPAPFDLWVARRASTSEPWSVPEKLGPAISSARDEGAASLSFDGTILYFTSDRLGTIGSLDLWMSTRTRLRGKEQ